MADQLPDVPGGPHLRTVAMPRDANAGGDIFGGWTLSQMDLAGGGYAADRAQCRVATVKVETWATGRGHGCTPEKVTEGVFTILALDEQGHSCQAPRTDGG